MKAERSVTRLQSEFARLCKRIDPSLARIRFRTTPGHDGSTHVEVSTREYHYIATERGQELFHKRTKRKDELLYWLVSDVAWSLACDYELKNRVKGQSFRRLLFAKELEYLEKVKPEWAKAKREEIEAILREHPYDDQAEG
jgi:hypothetical protein